MNEWGRVKKVIVGIANKARYVPDDIGVRQVNYADRSLDNPIPFGAYSQTIIDEANEALKQLAATKNEVNTILKELNGKKIKINSNYCIKDLIKKFKLKENKIAIELNGVILPKKFYSTKKIKNKDNIEIVQFIGGG